MPEAPWPPEKLVALRDRLVLTSRDLADRLGIDAMTVHLWTHPASSKMYSPPSSVACKMLDELSREMA